MGMGRVEFSSLLVSRSCSMQEWSLPGRVAISGGLDLHLGMQKLGRTT